MKKVFDAVVSSSYEDKKTGEKKRKYTNVGVVFENDKGQYSLKLETLPIAFDGWIQFYEPKPREEKSASPKQQQQESPPFDDEIPF